MALSDDLENEIKNVLSTAWQERNGQKIPDTEDVKLGNDAVKLDATVLYADLAESTQLVDCYRPGFAAKIYKSYLHCASKIIRAEGGVITAFDGDRVMGVFIGDLKNTSAARAALKINHAVVQIINPNVKKQFPTSQYEGVKHAVGVDTSSLFIARTGIRGSNDLVWVGGAANYAAKLCSLRQGNYASWITADVYKSMAGSIKKSPDGKDMWEARTWTAKDKTVYCSGWMWKP